MSSGGDDKEMKWFRPLLTFEGFTVVSWGFIVGIIDPVAYFGLVTAAFVWWFKSRDEAKRNGI